ncbi:hypothetical protein LKK83_02025 [Phormidium sp. CCY1219]|nr:hypothetical protein [Phormidium sp. CCY1219]
MNLRAGKKAKASAAYEAAFKYLQVGRELFGDRTWETHYELTLSLYVEAAEAAYVCGEFEAMERYVQGVLQQAKHLLDKVKIYEIKIQGCMAQNQPREAVKTALSVLKLLGINFPQKPTQLQIGLTLLKTKLLLAQKRIETLENLPPMRDAFHQAAMRILVSLFSAAYVSVPELLLPSICKMIDLSVKHGNAAESAFGYVCYGVILCGVVGDIEAGYTMGKLGVELADKNTAKEIQAKTLINGAMFVNFWKPPLIDTLTDFKKSYQI